MASGMNASMEMAEISMRLQGLTAELAHMKGDYDESLDTIWMLLAGLLVFFMHIGFSFLETGCVRVRNAQNILVKNITVVCLGFLCWWAVGYALAFGADVGLLQFAGSNDWFMDTFWEDKTLFRRWFFQGAFCATGATIVSGAIAERVRLSGYFVFVACMAAVIYPLIVFWTWSGKGFLNYTNGQGEVRTAWGGPAYVDFAGSGVVHLVGGSAALVGAAILGPRKDRWERPEDFAPHNIPFMVLGTLALWFGWYGFNPGSTGSMHDKATAERAGLVAVNTTLAPCVGGLVVFALRAFVFGPRLLDVGAFCNGILAGLVSVTAACAAVRPWEAFVIGLVGAFVYQGASMSLRILRIDDVVDAFPVHGACGLWGLLAAGLFGNPADGIGGNGFFYGGNQLLTQVVAIVAIVLWSGGLSVAVFLPLRAIGQLRLDDDFQDKGADFMEHSPERAYGAEDMHGNELVTV